MRFKEMRKMSVRACTCVHMCVHACVCVWVGVCRKHEADPLPRSAGDNSVMPSDCLCLLYGQGVQPWCL